MARNESRNLDAKSSVLAGAKTFVGDLKSAEVQVSGITSATVVIEGSIDGTNWVSIASKTSDAVQAITASWQYIRLNTTVWSSGTIKGQIVGVKLDESCAARNMEVKKSVASGASVYVGDLEVAQVQIGGTFSATMQVQGSPDGTNWYQFGSDYTGGGAESVADPVQYVRIKTTVYVSGTPLATVCGRKRTSWAARSMDIKKFAANPGTPTVTPGGTSGATTYGYKVVALNAAGQNSAASSAGTDTTGNATLSAINYEHVAWSAVAGAASYDVYRTTGGATQGKIGNTTGVTFDDTGLVAAGTAPTTNVSGLGSGLSVDDLSTPSILVSGTFVGTIQAQGSLDGTNWFNHGSTVTAPGEIPITETFNFLRCKMTAYTSGSPLATTVGAQ